MSYLIQQGIFQTGPLPVVPVGLIYSGSNLADWVLTNPSGAVSITQDGTDILMSGTNGTGGTSASNLFQDFISLNLSLITSNSPYGDAFNFTCLSDWQIDVDFTTGTVNAADSYGYSPGVISTNSFEARDTLSRLQQDNASSKLGAFYFYYGNTSATGIANQTAPAGGYAMTDDTRYIHRFRKQDLTLTSTLLDSTGSSVLNTKTTTDSPPGGTVTKVHHNTGRFAIAQHGGTTRIHNITITSDALRNVPFGVMGNSHAYGGKATSLANSMFRLALVGQDYFINAGWADRIVDMETRMKEVIAMNPIQLMIECGSNDVKAGTWASTGIPALDSSISQSQGAGIITRLMSAPARNDVDVSAVETYMNTLGLSVVQGYSSTKQAAGTGLLGPLNSGDGVHLNDAGHAVESPLIQTVFGI
jgi:hypothetical protein